MQFSQKLFHLNKHCLWELNSREQLMVHPWNITALKNNTQNLFFYWIPRFKHQVIWGIFYAKSYGLLCSASYYPGAESVTFGALRCIYFLQHFRVYFKTYLFLYRNWSKNNLPELAKGKAETSHPSSFFKPKEGKAVLSPDIKIHKSFETRSRHNCAVLQIRVTLHPLAWRHAISAHCRPRAGN